MSKIAPIAMFHTHKTYKGLEQWIENLSGSEKAVAYMAMGLTWNHLSYVTGGGDSPEEYVDRSSQNPYANVNPEED